MRACLAGSPQLAGACCPYSSSRDSTGLPYSIPHHLSVSVSHGGEPGTGPAVLHIAMPVTHFWPVFQFPRESSGPADTAS